MTTKGDINDSDSKDTPSSAMAAWHLRLGWWSLLVFLTLGVALELLHGFKIGWYLDVSNETRRFMWTLAHAHGTLLSVLHIAFAATCWLLGDDTAARLKTASRCLLAAGLLIPTGFFLGGVQFHSGDPGMGILLLPGGAFLLFVAALLTALHIKGVRR